MYFRCGQLLVQAMEIPVNFTETPFHLLEAGFRNGLEVIKISEDVHRSAMVPWENSIFPSQNLSLLTKRSFDNTFQRLEDRTLSASFLPLARVSANLHNWSWRWGISSRPQYWISLTVGWISPIMLASFTAILLYLNTFHDIYCKELLPELLCNFAHDKFRHMSIVV